MHAIAVKKKKKKGKELVRQYHFLRSVALFLFVIVSCTLYRVFLFLSENDLFWFM